MNRWPVALACLAGACALPAACDAQKDDYHPPALPTLDAGAETAAGNEAGPPDPPGPCTTTFRWSPGTGRAPKTVALAGEWNGFAKAGTQMRGPDADGAFTADVELPPGLVAYKVVVDGVYEMDPGARLRKYVGGVENSAVRVADCRDPVLSLAKQDLARPAAGQGRYKATVRFAQGRGQAAIDPASVTATLRVDGVESPATARAEGAEILVEASTLKDAKYTLFVRAKDRAGRAAKALRLVFWVEPEAFSWRDAVIYMAMIDRYRNGDPANDAAKTAGVDPRAEFQGGDLEGLRQKIADGTLDRLGVRALWLSPFHTNPKGSYVADDGVHQVMGYHGYWPVKAREVEPRIGGAAALRAMVREAHAHGIRVLQDFVVNHVHKEHEAFKAHPEWFRTGCVCGTAGCDWTGHRLDCLFADYLPDVNWTVTEASEAFVDDAVWWLDAFDLDGLRVDAVKHVEDIAVTNMATRIREEFEPAGTRVFLTGETAMGWSDCGLACNAEQYGTITRYIGPWQLDGQFDFVLYHAVPYRAFAADAKGMIHADYWAQASLASYPADAIMTPYIGSHDTPRFVTLATYRGQDGAHDPGIPGNKWSNIAGAPDSPEASARHRLALTWLLGLPGAPLLYYGDEYGQWGGADPNNRAMFREAVTGDEATTLAHVRALGKARAELVALRRGDYRSLLATEDDLVYARQSGGDVAIVALTRRAPGATLDVPIPLTLPLANGTALRDRLGGAGASVENARVSIALGPRGSAVLAR